eukprot:CAMPEP_0197715856 /NCGR_PEP_ID=MMETSP1434-20131217/941_1 /TAXON_ID=265543 /ORGANISM="Minutocellus polymorphus, Strain CCMP3303" /LENGTH=89 /DNA_ID=CAMNT_0043300103 /DNA_START=330 /DNA_END=595 /DNA_ORIENTATION=+
MHCMLLCEKHDRECALSTLDYVKEAVEDIEKSRVDNVRRICESAAGASLEITCCILRSEKHDGECALSALDYVKEAVKDVEKNRVDNMR